MTQLRIKHLIIAATTLCLFNVASAALAQYVWLDETGIKQYSDMPPPISVPIKRILKMPGSFSVPSSEAGSPTTAVNGENAASDADKAPTTLAEKNTAFKKRKTDQAEKDKKLADSAKNAATKTKSCDSARAFQRTLSSGQRVAQVDKNGQRAFLDDNQRSQATRDNQQVLDGCK